AMHVVIAVNGEVTVDQEFTAASGDLQFPTELRVEDVADGIPVDATVEGVVNGVTAVTRLASTQAVGGKDLLLEVELEAACLQVPGSPAPTCQAPGTCVKGVCKDSRVPGSELPEYEAGWANQTVDTCKPEGAGEPIVLVGEGQA